MKYIAPKYEAVVVKANEFITASPDSYEIEQDNSNGSVIIKAANLF